MMNPIEFAHCRKHQRNLTILRYSNEQLFSVDCFYPCTILNSNWMVLANSIWSIAYTKTTVSPVVGEVGWLLPMITSWELNLKESPQTLSTPYLIRDRCSINVNYCSRESFNKRSPLLIPFGIGQMSRVRAVANIQRT